MQIRLGCQCGQQLITDDMYAGQVIRCPHCSILLRVPQLQSQGVPPQAAPVPPGALPGPVPAAGPVIASPLPPTTEVFPAETLPPGCQVPGFPTAAPPQFPQAQMAPPAAYPPGQGLYPGPPLLGAIDQPILEDDDETGDTKQRRKKARARTRRRQLQVSSAGLTMIFWSIACLLGAIGATILIFIISCIAITAFIISTVSGEPVSPDVLAGPGPVLLILLIGSFVLGLGHLLLYLAGSVLCCWIPPKSGARPFILVSVALIGGSLGCFVVVIFQFFGILAANATGIALGTLFTGRLVMALAVVATLLGIGGFVLFMLFLRAVCYYLDENAVAEEVGSILARWIILGVMIVPLALVVSFLMMFLMPMAPIIASPLSGALVITWFAFWLRQWIRLLNAVGAIRRALAYEFGI